MWGLPHPSTKEPEANAAWLWQASPLLSPVMVGEPTIHEFICHRPDSLPEFTIDQRCFSPRIQFGAYKLVDGRPSPTMT
jgi:hypothetical protein